MARANCSSVCSSHVAGARLRLCAPGSWSGTASLQQSSVGDDPCAGLSSVRVVWMTAAPQPKSATRTNSAAGQQSSPPSLEVCWLPRAPPRNMPPRRPGPPTLRLGCAAPGGGVPGGAVPGGGVPREAAHRAIGTRRWFQGRQWHSSASHSCVENVDSRVGFPVSSRCSSPCLLAFRLSVLSSRCGPVKASHPAARPRPETRSMAIRTAPWS